jgi:hypothetical protein
VFDFLVEKARWLTDAESLDLVKVGKAIAKGLKLSAS